jgi:hypothetical protein
MTPVDRPAFQHPTLTAFAAEAERFCALVEARSTVEFDTFLVDVHRSLAVLYTLGLALPPGDVLWDDANDDEADDDDAEIIIEVDPDRHSHEEWDVLFKELGARLGARNAYREIFDPYESPNNPAVTGSLADDIADTYHDIRCGLRKWRRFETGEALWEWRFQFEIHWSEHALGAMRALRSLASNDRRPWPSTDVRET